MWVDIIQFESEWGIRSSNFELKKRVVNQRYLTLTYTDFLSSSDSFFEDEKEINFIFDIVIGVQSYYNSYISHYYFLAFFNAPGFDPRFKMTKEFLK